MNKTTPAKRKFPWWETIVFSIGILNLLAIAALFAFKPDNIEPLKTPWEWWSWIARAQFIPAVLAMDFSIIGAAVAATILLGRIWCEAVCPLGVAQDILRKASRLNRLSVRRVCPRLPVSNRQWVLRLSILAAAVAAALCGLGAFWLDPYAIFCRFLTLFNLDTSDSLYIIFAAVPFAAVAILSFVGKGRFWCNAICPAGTVFAILAKFKIGKTPFNSACANCRACFPVKQDAATKPEKGEKQ